MIFVPTINLYIHCWLFRRAEMSWDFMVPVCLDDLVKSGAINQYVVQDVLSAKQLPSHINSKCC